MSLFPRTTLHNLENFFDHNWHPFKDGGSKFGAIAPRVDVHESDKQYEISVELPGIDKKDIHVSLKDGVLSIEAESNEENVEKKDGRIVRQERHHGRFVRSFDLGRGIHENDIQAKHKDGILTVITPKQPSEAEDQKRISID